MGDQTKAAFAPQPAGQPAGDADQQQQSLTQATEGIEPSLLPIEEQIWRRLQGYYEADRTRLREEMQALKQQLAAPQPSTPNALPPAMAPEQPQTGQPEQPPDPVTAEGWRMMQEAGIEIDDADPEFASIVNTTPYAWLRSIESAIAAKSRRTGHNNPPPPVATVPARTPTNAGGLGGQTLGAETLTVRLQELMKHPLQNMTEIERLTEELDKFIPRG
jgi:hypothetical protein